MIFHLSENWTVEPYIYIIPVKNFWEKVDGI